MSWVGSRHLMQWSLYWLSQMYGYLIFHHWTFNPLYTNQNISTNSDFAVVALNFFLITVQLHLVACSRSWSFINVESELDWVHQCEFIIIFSDWLFCNYQNHWVLRVIYRAVFLNPVIRTSTHHQCPGVHEAMLVLFMSFFAYLAGQMQAVELGWLLLLVWDTTNLSLCNWL